MDTMKVLLGATLGLLVAMVVLAFMNLDQERSSELERLRLENAQLKANSAMPAPIPALPATAPETVETVPDETQKELQRLKAELAAVNEQARKRAEAEAAARAEIAAAPEEETEPTSLPDKLEKRAFAIKNALLMGTVQTYNEDYNYVTFQVHREGSIDTGMQLAIRRKTGIVGRIKVTELLGPEGIADALVGTFFKGVDIQPGDQLIIPPL